MEEGFILPHVLYTIIIRVPLLRHDPFFELLLKCLDVNSSINIWRNTHVAVCVCKNICY